jgi:hypothetical protein
MSKKRQVIQDALILENSIEEATVTELPADQQLSEDIVTLYEHAEAATSDIAELYKRLEKLEALAKKKKKTEDYYVVGMTVGMACIPLISWIIATQVDFYFGIITGISWFTGGIVYLLVTEHERR